MNLKELKKAAENCLPDKDSIPLPENRWVLAHLVGQNPKIILAMIKVIEAANECPDKNCDIHYWPSMKKALKELEGKQ